MRVFSVVLMVICALLLVGCGNDSRRDGRDADGRLFNGAKTIDEAVGVFWRVEASYRVKDTGERLDFNYVVSAFNRDVVGSYSGEFFPKVVFKKTKNNAVLAVDAPIYYHTDGFERPPAYGVKDVIPRIAWYPNADDMRYAETYVTSEAYHSPRAAIEFLDFKVTPVTREDSKAWWAAHQETREPTGTYILPTECERERDKIFFVSQCKESLSGPPSMGYVAQPDPDVASVVIWPREAFERYKKIRSFKAKYVCRDDTFEPLINKRHSQYSLSPKEKEEQKYLRDIWNEIRYERRPQSGNIWYTGAKRSKSVALGVTDGMMVNPNSKTLYVSRPVTPFYPVINHVETVSGHSGKAVLQILMRPEWRGFGLPMEAKISDISDQFEALEYKGDAQSAVYINDELICTSPHNKTNFLIYDMELGRSISIGRDL